MCIRDRLLPGQEAVSVRSVRGQTGNCDACAHGKIHHDDVPLSHARSCVHVLLLCDHGYVLSLIHI